MTARVVRYPSAAADLTGLVLTAGGARGAYQAGVLKRIGEVPGLRDRPAPFDIIAGASAGAINGAALAAHGERFHEATEKLASLWAGLTASQVYRTDLRALAINAGRLVRDAAFAPLFGAGRMQALLDAAPLRALLERELSLPGIRRAVEQRRLYALAITATGYHSGKSYTFIQGRPRHPLWRKSRRIALPASIGVDHVCASAAIPLVFPPVALSTGGAMAWFGDGAMRLTNPLSPAIRLGAKRVLAIGIRCSASEQQLTETELAAHVDTAHPESSPAAATAAVVADLWRVPQCHLSRSSGCGYRPSDPHERTRACLYRRRRPRAPREPAWCTRAHACDRTAGDRALGRFRRDRQRTGQTHAGIRAFHARRAGYARPQERRPDQLPAVRSELYPGAHRYRLSRRRRSDRRDRGLPASLGGRLPPCPGSRQRSRLSLAAGRTPTIEEPERRRFLERAEALDFDTAALVDVDQGPACAPYREAANDPAG